MVIDSSDFLISFVLLYKQVMSEKVVMRQTLLVANNARPEVKHRK